MRLVLHKEKRPIEVEGRWVCQCGLSNNLPFYDGGHNKTKDEEEGKVYRYNDDGTREVVE